MNFKTLLLIITLLSCYSCSMYASPAERHCSDKTFRHSPDWWVCMDNERMLEQQAKIKQEVRKKQAQRSRALFQAVEEDSFN